MGQKMRPGSQNPKGLFSDPSPIHYILVPSKVRIAIKKSGTPLLEGTVFAAALPGTIPNWVGSLCQLPRDGPHSSQYKRPQTRQKLRH